MNKKLGFDPELRYGYPLEIWKNFDDLPNERWIDVEGYEGRFQISDYGRIKSLGRTVRKGLSNGMIGIAVKLAKIRLAAPNKKGYHRLDLLTYEKRKTFYISRLVAYYFIEKRQPGFEVNHKDGNKHNNHYSNLEWVTSRENKIHAVTSGLRKVKKVNQIDINSGLIIKTFNSTKEVCKFLGLCYESIRKIAQKQKIYNGYLWKYE